MIAQSTVEQVRAYPDIVAIISEYVSLKKRGRNYIGLCPFHSEKTPSFTVSPEKKIFHCFGCHESGDSIAFVMALENASFSDAVRHIAHRAGIEVVEEQGHYHPKDDDRAKLQDLMSDAKEIFKAQLNAHKDAYTYLSDRGLTPDTIAQFSLGFAPMTLTIDKLLQGKGYDLSLILKSGLVYKNDQGVLVSRFRGRVIFPVLDHRGRTVAFGGRIIESNSNYAKYVNSEDTLLFNKRRILYALNEAKRHVKDTDTLLIVEGYMDVLLAHQFGFKNTVAAMGTAITENHAQLIKRFVPKVVLAMDSDEAGQAATRRSYEVLSKVGIKVLILELEEKDPADFLLKYGAEVFAQKYHNLRSMIEVEFDRLLQSTPLNSVENITEVISKMLPFLKQESDLVSQRLYVNNIAKRLQVEPELIMAKIKNHLYNVSNRKIVTLDRVSSKAKYEKAEEQLMSVLASDLQLRAQIFHEFGVDLFVSDTMKQLAAQIQQLNVVDHELLAQIHEPEQHKLLSRLVVEGENKEWAAKASGWQDCVAVLQDHKKRQRVAEIKAKLQQLDDKGSDADIKQLLAELDSLKR